jgi:hypothetical protein
VGCICNVPYSGDDCTKLDGEGCPNSCSGNGNCNDGHCVCIPGWSGLDCSAAVTEQQFLLSRNDQNATADRGVWYYAEGDFAPVAFSNPTPTGISYDDTYWKGGNSNGLVALPATTVVTAAPAVLCLTAPRGAPLGTAPALNSTASSQFTTVAATAQAVGQLVSLSGIYSNLNFAEDFSCVAVGIDFQNGVAGRPILLMANIERGMYTVELTVDANVMSPPNNYGSILRLYSYQGSTLLRTAARFTSFTERLTFANAAGPGGFVHVVIGAIGWRGTNIANFGNYGLGYFVMSDPYRNTLGPVFEIDSPFVNVPFQCLTVYNGDLWGIGVAGGVNELKDALWCWSLPTTFDIVTQRMSPQPSLKSTHLFPNGTFCNRGLPDSGDFRANLSGGMVGMANDNALLITGAENSPIGPLGQAAIWRFDIDLGELQLEVGYTGQFFSGIVARP